MDRNIQDDICHGSGYRIRCMQSLIEQIRQDQAECISLWERFEKGDLYRYEEEELKRTMSWLREGLNLLRRMRKRGIESVSWGEMEEMERDIRKKERKLKTINSHKY